MSENKSLLQKLFNTAKLCLLSGGAIMKKGFYQPRKVQFKSSTSPVTHVDLAIEKELYRIIRGRFPSHDILSEESDYAKHGDPLKRSFVRRQKENSRFNYRWVIDPLDGTVNFLHHFPQSSVSVAVEKDGVVLAGGVYDPFRNELFMAMKNKGATLNGKKITVSKEKKLSKSLLVTGFPYDHRQRANYYLNVAKPFLAKSMDLRRLGSAALDLSWVACGRVEGYWEYNLNPWDVAAGWLLVEEAGGRLSNFKNQPYNLEKPQETLASNGFIHKSMVRLFRKP